MSALPTIDTAERRRRVAVRYHLAAACRGSDVSTVAGELVGLHATDPTSVYIGAFARVRDVTPDDIARALYEERTLLGLVGVRRTMFATTAELGGSITSATARPIAAAERRRMLQMLSGAGVADDVGSWLAEIESQTMAVLEEIA